MVAEGRQAGVDFFLSRPPLSPRARRYFNAWLGVSRYRPYFSHSLSMAGSMLLRQVLPREAIEKEGERLGYRGEALEVFIEILTRINAIDFGEDFKRQQTEIAAAVNKNAQSPGALPRNPTRR